jgi:SWI/SNF-related matrix-associated actin-dependent regulator of chromatin subfamily A-like protein 1
MRWDVLILDEQHFGKNPEAQRTKAVLGKGGLGWYARRIWAASGTPAPNNAAELWPLLYAFGKTKQDPQSFKYHYCVVSQDGKVRGNRDDRLPELRAMLKSFSLRRRKVDVLKDLGPLNVQEWFVDPSADCIDMAQYADVAGQEEMLRQALQGKTPSEMLAFLAGDKEFSSVRRYAAMLKVPAVADAIAFEHKSGLLDKVVVFGYHVDPMYALQDRLAKAGVRSMVVSGRETDAQRKNRDARIEHWKTHNDTPVLIASINVAATALDLTAAHQGIMLELDWVPGNNSQAMQRMHRYGQLLPVVGTPVDEVVSDVLVRKTRDLTQIFDA